MKVDLKKINSHLVFIWVLKPLQLHVQSIFLIIINLGRGSSLVIQLTHLNIRYVVQCIQFVTPDIHDAISSIQFVTLGIILLQNTSNFGEVYAIIQVVNLIFEFQLETNNEKKKWNWLILYSFKGASNLSYFYNIVRLYLLKNSIWF